MNQQHPTIEDLTGLYHQLSAAYGSPFSDHANDLTSAAWALREPIKAGITTEQLINRIRLLRRKGNGFTSKLSAVIADKFWLKEFVQPVTPSFYKPDEPVL